MNKEKLMRYALIKSEIKLLEAEMGILNTEILEDIESSGADKVKSDFGTFSIERRKKWQYSETTLEIKNAFDKAKELEEADGTATFTESKSLKFFAPRNGVETGE